MRIVHLADLHLGFRQYTRTAPNGVNQREWDVQRTFEGLIDDVIAIRPDLVVIAGDVFHTVRPSNIAVLHAFKQLKRLARPVVIAAGNHDLPRASDLGCILRLFEEIPGVTVADSGVRCSRGLPAYVVAVPDVAGLKLADLRPGPFAPPRILVLHGEVAGAMPPGVPRTEHEIPVSALHLDEWDYVAVGHYHVTTQIAPNAWYSGSMDYTSSDPWGELREESKKELAGKGFLEYDTETKQVTRHAVRNTRPLVDLPVVNAEGLTAAEVDALIRGAVASVPGGIEGKIVRCRILDIPVPVSRDLDVAALREYRKAAFAFTPDYRRPERASSVAGRGAARSVPLATLLGAAIAERAAASGIPASELAALGERYLSAAEDAMLNETA